MYHCFGVELEAEPSACGSTGSNASEPSELLCIFYEPANPVTKNCVGQGKVQTKKCDRHRNHDRRRNYIRTRRPVDLAHLDAHIMKKRPKALPLQAKLSNRLEQCKPADILVVRFLLFVELCRLRHFRTAFESPTSNYLLDHYSLAPFPYCELAGEEGFEPPLSVLETDGLPLNLLPYIRACGSLLKESPQAKGGGDTRQPRVICFISLLCGRCVFCTYCRTSTSPAAQCACGDSSSLCSSGSYNHCTVA